MSSKKLTFQSYDLGKDVVLMFTFDAGQDTTGGKETPLCWKVFTFPAHGGGEAVVELSGKTAFFVPQMDGNLVQVSISKNCHIGKNYSLHSTQHEGPGFTRDSIGTSDKISCVNKTGSVTNICIGFVPDTLTVPEPAILWKEVASNSTLTFELNPTLRIYATSAYKETEIIKGYLGAPLFSQDLSSLRTETCYTVSINRAGQPVIEKTY